MQKYLSAHLAAVAAAASLMVLLDVAWIGFIAKPLYQEGIGHLMASQPRLGPALLFYAVYALGLALFVIAPQGHSVDWQSTLVRGALFGLVAYATYDLSNLATLRDWPVRVAVVDMAWGAFASCSASAAGKAAWDYVAERA